MVRRCQLTRRAVGEVLLFLPAFFGDPVFEISAMLDELSVSAGRVSGCLLRVTTFSLLFSLGGAGLKCAYFILIDPGAKLGSQCR